MQLYESYEVSGSMSVEIVFRLEGYVIRYYESDKQDFEFLLFGLSKIVFEKFRIDNNVVTSNIAESRGKPEKVLQWSRQRPPSEEKNLLFWHWFFFFSADTDFPQV